MSEPYVAIRVVMMPADTNPHGTIFGGVILSNIDMAGAIAARREVHLRGGNPRASFVTVALNRVEFKQPVLVGDVVSFNTTVGRIGRTSITINVDVVAERGAETIDVTTAEAVFVGVDLSTPDRKPVVLLNQTPGSGESGA
ncbi:MAG: acyl-CoA thioesterase [Gemmataceae bacterium]|nr:acyl-CoA thioesterase [Gemmataceae bacterium]